MTKTQINSQDAEITIIGIDGSTLSECLNEHEQAILLRLDTLLKSHPDFQKAYPQAHLIRVDSLRGVDDTDKGRFYMRYQFGSQITEFWGHVAASEHVDCKRGIVSIKI